MKISEQSMILLVLEMNYWRPAQGRSSQVRALWPVRLQIRQVYKFWERVHSQSITSSIRFSFRSICFRASELRWLVLQKWPLVRSSFSFSRPCCENGASVPCISRNWGMWLTRCIYGVTCFVWYTVKRSDIHFFTRSSSYPCYPCLVV